MELTLLEASAGAGNGIELGWFSWLIVGLIAGALAKLILPGKQGGGFFATLILGVIGAVLGGVIAGLVFGFNNLGFWNLWTWVFAVLGSIVVLLLWGLVTRGRKRP